MQKFDREIVGKKLLLQVDFFRGHYIGRLDPGSATTRGGLLPEAVEDQERQRPRLAEDPPRQHRVGISR